LESVLAVGLAEGGDPVTATRVWLSLNVDEPESAQITAPEVDAEAADEGLDEAGFLERLESIEDTFPRMTEQVDEISEILNNLGEEAQTVGQEMQLLNSSHAPTNTRLTAVRRFSEAIQPYADGLTASTSAFSNEMLLIDKDVAGILDFIGENPERLNEAQGFLDTLISLAQSSRDGMEGINGFGGVVRDLGKISKLLRRPGRQMAKAIDTMAAATAVMDDWEAEALRLRRRQADTDSSHEDE
jgi:hypothetical protein